MASSDDITTKSTDSVSQSQLEQQEKLDFTRKWLQSFRERFPVDLFKSAQTGFYDSVVSQSLVVETAEHGRVVCCLRVPPRLSNSVKRLHGGAITSLVDLIGSAAIFSTGATYTGVSVEINVTFMSAASLDEDIEIEGKILRIGRLLAVAEVNLRVKSTGQLVAQGRHTKYIGLPDKPSKL